MFKSCFNIPQNIIMWNWNILEESSWRTIQCFSVASFHCRQTIMSTSVLSKHWKVLFWNLECLLFIKHRFFPGWLSESLWILVYQEGTLFCIKEENEEMKTTPIQFFRDFINLWPRTEATIPAHGLLDVHMFLDSNMCFHLNCWNVYMAPWRVINISKSSKNEGPLWPHTLCFDSVFKMSESHKSEQSAFYIYLFKEAQWKKILP